MVALLGSVVIGVASSSRSPAASWGFALCLVSALAYSGGVVPEKPALRSHSALQVTWLACVAAAVAVFRSLPSSVAYGSSAGHSRASEHLK